MRLHCIYLFHRSLKNGVQKVVEHAVFRILTILLILIDFTITVIGLADEDTGGSALEIVSHAIISYFMLELGARLFYLE